YIWEPMRLSIPVDSLDKPDSADVTASDTLLKNSGKSLKDTTVKVIVDTLDAVTSNYSGFPFRYYRYPLQGDSIKAAVNQLLDYIEKRDSSIIHFTGSGGSEYPLWLNSRSKMMIRYWLKNDLNDSVTVWIGNQGRDTIGLYLEQGVSFRRPARQGNVSEARIDFKKQDNSSLVNISKIMTKTQYWQYHTEASFALTQGMLTNWVKGGESSISTALDITWFADYNNKSMLLSSNNFARIKYGLIASATDGIRKNLDLLETNSKLNHKAFGKFDFSGIMLFKTQVSRGYNYPNDSIPVSKFLNPAILTLGIGLDYKPNSQTSINFSPLSYKVTFVPDTVHIDQTRYGIAKDRRSKHEPGASFLISNEFKPIKTVTVTNRLQLFTNYIHKPQNIDLDWEMIVQANLNWFTDVRLNTHLIFDDDTKTPVFDRERNPVLGLDGLQKKTARIQFKELLGFSFIFRF
ncbi:MAG: DUF3078 domain-containing protein, partial [Bacteroidota bacterium]|nr:DUF3078 domain-containing protein [Bacteroidota bacterium]